MIDIFSPEYSVRVNSLCKFEMRDDGIHRITNERFGYYRDELVMPKEFFVKAYEEWIKEV